MSSDAPVASRPSVSAATEALLDSWDAVQDVVARVPGLVERRFGVAPHRLHVLRAVERGASRIQDIAEASWTSVSAASRTVDGLVREGWMDRQPDPEDRRATRVTMTEVGRGHLDEIRTWARGMVAELVESLGPDRVERMAADLAAFAVQIDDHLDRDTA